MIEPFLLLPQHQSAVMMIQFFVLGQSNSTDNKAPKPNCSDDDPLLRTNSGSSSLHFGFLGLVVGAVTLTSEGQRPGCDIKDGECLDEKQVFFQLLSELHDSKDSDPGVAAHPRWRWRQMASAQPLPSVPQPSLPSARMVATVGPPSTTSTPASTVTIPVWNVNGVLLGSNDTSV